MVGGILALVAGALAADSSLAVAEKPGFIQVEPAVAVDAPPLVIRNATVIDGEGHRYSPGYVTVEGGKIRAIGVGEPPAVAGAVIVDGTGRFVTPGLIDTHSHLGVYPSPGSRAHSDGNEMTAPTTPGVWAESGVWPQDPGFERAIAGGVTTMAILPGSGNLIGGRGVIVRSVPARGGRAMRLGGAPEILKMACGENPKRVYGDKGSAPSTRMGNVRGYREAFLSAVEYQKTWAQYDRDLEAYRTKLEASKKDPSKKDPGAEKPAEPRVPARDLAAETLVGVMEGRILPQIHCYTADDMLSMLQVGAEFGFRVRSFHHALEAYKIRDVLAKERVSVSTWADWWGFKVEAYDGIPYNLALTQEAGGIPVVHTDSPIGIQRMNQEAAKAYRYGLEAGISLTPDDAIRWVTSNPAWALGIEDQVGSLVPGKRGDIVLWSADPLSVYAKAEKVYVDGALQYDAANPPRWSDYLTGQGVQP